MERDELLRRASLEAAKALNLEKEPGLKFQRRGGTKYWDEGAYREIFEVNFRVWKRDAYYNIQLNPDDGSLISWSNSTAIADTKAGQLTGQEAVRIAQEELGNKVPNDAGAPQVRDVVEQGNALILITWKSPSTHETIEALVHPGSKRICRLSRIKYPSANN